MTTGASEAPRISIRNVTKTFKDDKGEARTALRDVSLDVQPGQFTVLLGPSGCGKTTLLRCVAGLETPTMGEIDLNGRTVFSDHRRVSVPTERRDLSMVFQSYALWPHMTNVDNVAFPLKSKKVPTAEGRARAEEMLELVGLGERTRAYPGQLSGGQQQRVALARAIVSSSGVVLFDEPLSNLDAKVRERLRYEVVNLHRQIGFSALYVTHDQAEAMSMADVVVVMNNGTIEQVGSPADVYERPATRYVANFVGSLNELAGEVVQTDGARITVDTAWGRIVGHNNSTDEFSTGNRVVVGIRPERVQLQPVGTPGTLAARVEQRIFLGGTIEYVLDSHGTRALVRESNGELQAEGAEVAVRISGEPAVFHDEGGPLAATGVLRTAQR